MIYTFKISGNEVYTTNNYLEEDSSLNGNCTHYDSLGIVSEL